MDVQPGVFTDECPGEGRREFLSRSSRAGGAGEGQVVVSQPIRRGFERTTRVRCSRLLRGPSGRCSRGGCSAGSSWRRRPQETWTARRPHADHATATRRCQLDDGADVRQAASRGRDACPGLALGGSRVAAADPPPPRPRFPWHEPVLGGEPDQTAGGCVARRWRPAPSRPAVGFAAGPHRRAAPVVPGRSRLLRANVPPPCPGALGTIWGPLSANALVAHTRQTRLAEGGTCLTCENARTPELGVKGSQVQILSSRRLDGRFPDCGGPPIVVSTCGNAVAVLGRVGCHTRELMIRCVDVVAMWSHSARPRPPSPRGVLWCPPAREGRSIIGWSRCGRQAAGVEFPPR